MRAMRAWNTFVTIILMALAFVIALKAPVSLEGLLLFLVALSCIFSNMLIRVVINLTEGVDRMKEEEKIKEKLLEAAGIEEDLDIRIAAKENYRNLQ